LSLESILVGLVFRGVCVDRVLAERTSQLHGILELEMRISCITVAEIVIT
jgi:hypothetical protein